MSDALCDELTALTCDLARFESTNERPDQLVAVIDYVAAYLADIPGLIIERSSSNHKPALVVTLREGRTPALMLNGHLDVVLGHARQFTPEVRDGRIYARGAQDMKGSCAVMLRLIRDLAARADRPDVGFQFVTDEEIGGVYGTGRLLDEGWHCDFMLCLEPTDMGILFEHKAAMWVELQFPGQPAHGSRPWAGVNPILALNRGLTQLEAAYPTLINEQWRTTITPTHVATAPGSRNQVPSGLSLTLDIRYTSEDTPDGIMATLARCFPEATGGLKAQGPRLYTDPEHPKVVRVAKLIEQRLGQTPSFFREHYATDARYYTSAGVPAICVGPVGAGLHSDEEWVSVASLADLHAVLTDYILG